MASEAATPNAPKCANLAPPTLLTSLACHCSAEQARQHLQTGRKCHVGRSIHVSFCRLDLTIQDFDILKVLGEGSLSTVFLVRRRATGTEHALKVIDKYYITRQNMTDSVVRERHVMDKMHSEWVVKLQFTFQVPRIACT